MHTSSLSVCLPTSLCLCLSWLLSISRSIQSEEVQSIHLPAWPKEEEADQSVCFGTDNTGLPHVLGDEREGGRRQSKREREEEEEELRLGSFRVSRWRKAEGLRRGSLVQEELSKDAPDSPEINLLGVRTGAEKKFWSPVPERNNPVRHPAPWLSQSPEDQKKKGRRIQ